MTFFTCNYWLLKDCYGLVQKNVAHELSFFLETISLSFLAVLIFRRELNLFQQSVMIGQNSTPPCGDILKHMNCGSLTVRSCKKPIKVKKTETAPKKKYCFLIFYEISIFALEKERCNPFAVFNNNSNKKFSQERIISAHVH